MGDGGGAEARCVDTRARVTRADNLAVRDPHNPPMVLRPQGHNPLTSLMGAGAAELAESAGWGKRQRVPDVAAEWFRRIPGRWDAGRGRLRVAGDTTVFVAVAGDGLRAGIGGRCHGGGRGPIGAASPGHAVNRAGGECPGRGGAGCSPGVCTRIGGGAGPGAGCARRRGYDAVWFCAAAAGAAVYPSAGSTAAAPSIPTEGSSGGGSSAPGGGAGLMPVAGRRDGAPVRRDLAASDVESARIAVAELAAAATVTDPGLDWAVAVGHNRTSGMTTLWVATNDGATYIPPGVHLRKTMPVAAKFDEDFDTRWFGWANPADKAVRAARACGDDVGAVATTWAYPSDYLADDAVVREVATGVPPSGRDTPAAGLLPSRSHRLQTVDAALYGDLKAASESVMQEYCRELVRRLVFGAAGDELPAIAQSVAQALVAERWPKAEEWAP